MIIYSNATGIKERVFLAVYGGDEEMDYLKGNKENML